MEQYFEAAAKHSKDHGGNAEKSAQLKMYTLFKQSTEGDLPLSKPRPSAFSIVERAKYDGWEKLRGMDKSSAKVAYVKTVVDANIGFSIPRNENEVEATTEQQPQETKAEPHISGAVTPFAFSVPTLVCFGIVALGLSGFVFSILSWNALFFLIVTGLGFGGLLGSFLNYIDQFGLISLLPSGMKTILLETTLLEFLLSDSLSRLGTQLVPLFLFKAEDPGMKEALMNLSPSLRTSLTQKGFIHLLPQPLKSMMIPRCARESTLRSPILRELPYFPPVSEAEKKSLQGASRLSKRAIESMLRSTVKQVLNPQVGKMLEMISVSLASFSLMQLLFSSANREFLLAFVRSLLLLISMTGSGITGLLRLAAWQVVQARGK